MAEKRATFILRRFFSLGFSKCRWLRTSFNVPSRSMRFFKRRKAFSTDSPFFSLISVNSFSLPLADVQRWAWGLITLPNHRVRPETVVFGLCAVNSDFLRLLHRR